MEKNKLMIGAAKREITPPKELLPLPLIWTVQFVDIADSLNARALMFSDGQDKSLLITLDICEIPYPEETIDFLVKNTGLKKENILIASTHTHEAPFIGFGIYQGEDERKCRCWYDDTILPALLAVAKEAESKLKPAKYGCGEGKSYINVNRDEIIDGKAVIGNNYARPSDKTLNLIRFEDYDGNIIAMFINYSVHATALNGCLIDGNEKISGDIPGRTASALEEKFEGAVVLWTSGAAGDQNPRYSSNYGTMLPGTKPAETTMGEKGYILLEVMVREHIRDILSVNSNLVCDKTAGKLFCGEKEVACKGNPKLKENPPDAKYVLRLFAFGDVVFEGISAEVVTLVGKAVRESSPYPCTIMITHAIRFGGYVPDEWEYDNNAFEAESTPVAKGEALPAFIAGYKELFDLMKNK